MKKEEARLHEMNKQLADRKEDVAGFRGEQQQILKQLKAEDCSSAKQAETEAKKEEKKSEKLETKLQSEMKGLEEYEWD